MTMRYINLYYIKWQGLLRSGLHLQPGGEILFPPRSHTVDKAVGKHYSSMVIVSFCLKTDLVLVISLLRRSLFISYSLVLLYNV